MANLFLPGDADIVGGNMNVHSGYVYFGDGGLLSNITSVPGATGATGFVSGSIAFGEMYEYDGATITLTSSTQTYPWTNTIQGDISQMTYNAGTGGAASNLVIIEGGVYQVNGSFSISVDTNDVQIETSVAVNGSILPETTTVRGFQGTSRAGAYAMTHLINLNTGDQVSVRFGCANRNNVGVDINNVSLNLTKCVGIGATGPMNTYTGVQGATGVNVLTPSTIDKNISSYAGTAYDIDPNNYLPAGKDSVAGGLNMLPVQCDKFAYLEVIADMSQVGSGASTTVYIPCYYN